MPHGLEKIHVAVASGGEREELELPRAASPSGSLASKRGGPPEACAGSAPARLFCELGWQLAMLSLACLLEQLVFLTNFAVSFGIFS